MAVAPEAVFDPAISDPIVERLRHRPDDGTSTWTLTRIQAHCPTVAGYSLSGCWRLLRRVGLRLRRGRPHHFSPDPAYAAKRDHLLARLRAGAAAPTQQVVLFLDEFTYYHWPLVGRTWAPGDGSPPRAERAAPGEMKRRVVATLDAWTGQVLAHQDRAISKDVFARFLRQVAAAYPTAQRITVVLDNWPVHHSPLVLETVAALPQLELLFLPTYAPWLNPIEKLWLLLKEDLLRFHPYAGRWTDLQQAVTASLASYADPSPQLLARVGLTGSGALADALHPATDFHRQT